MIWNVVKKEILSNLNSPRVIITYIVCAVLILTSVFTGIINYLTITKEVDLQTAAEKDRLRNILNFQQDYLNRGLYVYRDPGTLSILVNGVEGDAARRATMMIFVTPGFDVSRFNSTPILAIFGILDLEFIVKIILSLFAILFTYDAISGEKELGTLKLNFANGIKRSEFIIGKLVGTFLLLIIPFIIPILLGLLMMNFYPGVVISGEEWIRILLLMLAFVLYLLTFFSMGMMVSSLTKNSNVSFLILLMLWVLMIAIIPRASVLIAQSVHPTPSVDEIQKDIVLKIGPAQRIFQRSVQEKAQALREEAQKRDPGRAPIIRTPEWEAKNKAYQEWLEQARAQLNTDITEGFQEFSNKLMNESNRVIEEAGRRQEMQNNLAISISRLTSPAGALTFSSNRMSLSGVYTADEQFKRNIRQAAKTFVTETNDLLREHPEYLNYQGQQGSPPIDVSNFYPDTRQFKSESLSESINASLYDYFSLFILSIIFMSIAFVAFIRYDVR